MNKKLISRLLVVSSLVAFPVLAQSPPAAGAPKGHGACKRIEQACISAGFVAKAFKTGNGLWRDCVNPIMQNTTPTCEAGVKCLALPAVNPQDVTTCKAAHPKFGQGKVGG